MAVKEVQCEIAVSEFKCFQKEKTLPLIIELNTIIREKISIYSVASMLKITNTFISELIIYTDIKLSGSKSVLVDDLGFKPWYAYFDMPSFTYIKSDRLIVKKDSTVGGGILTLINR